MRSSFVLVLLVFLSSVQLTSRVCAAEVDLAMATAADLQTALEKGALTSEKLVSLYLARIEAYDAKGPKLNTVIALAKDALAQARTLDAVSYTHLTLPTNREV